jgi:hypothetical protein
VLSEALTIARTEDPCSRVTHRSPRQGSERHPDRPGLHRRHLTASLTLDGAILIGKALVTDVPVPSYNVPLSAATIAEANVVRCNE